MMQFVFQISIGFFFTLYLTHCTSPGHLLPRDSLGITITLVLQISVNLGASPIEARQGSPERKLYPTYRQQLLDSPYSSCSGPT